MSVWSNPNPAATPSTAANVAATTAGAAVAPDPDTPPGPNYYDLTCIRDYDAIRATIATGGPPSPKLMWSCIQCAICVNARDDADIVKSARFFLPLVDSCGSEYATEVVKLGAPRLKHWAKQGLDDYSNSAAAQELDRIITEWTTRYGQ